MKKVLILSVLAFLLSSCACVIGQVPPPQDIYIDENCQAIVPDYTYLFTYTDNCKIDTVFQYPEAGYILTAEENSIWLQIIAVDEFVNVTTVMFPVTVRDSIGPEIFYDLVKVGTVLGADSTLQLTEGKYLFVIKN